MGINHKSFPVWALKLRRQCKCDDFRQRRRGIDVLKVDAAGVGYGPTAIRRPRASEITGVLRLIGSAYELPKRRAKQKPRMINL